ncbi:Histone-lysine N-methyltransferase, H3 lysine-9 specific SUVH3-like protein [Drosera capensis]
MPRSPIPNTTYKVVRKDSTFSTKEMEAPAGQNSVPPVFDKSRVFDVKPMRTLVPLFPNPPQAPPFFCSSPFGPFPSGFSPFFPFSASPGAQPASAHVQEETGDPDPHNEEPDHDNEGSFETPAAAVPLRSFGTPQMGAGSHFSGVSNGHTGSSAGMGGDGFSTRSSKRSGPRQQGTDPSMKKTRKARDSSSAEASKRALQNSALGLSQAIKEDGDREVVKHVLLKYDAVRRRLSQLEDSKEATLGMVRRADLKSGNIMLTAGIRTNARKRIGAVPGVEIGDIFFFRMEMCVVGLHAPSMAGIDYMTVSGDMGEEPLAVSIVSSGGYEDDAEDKDVLVYTGQGGNIAGGGNTIKDKEASDQKLIQEAWIEKTKAGTNSFKYKLVRLPGQPSAFAVWQSVQRWKAGNASRAGLILTDLTSGAESSPVSLVNDIDDEKGPSYFTYFPTVRYSKSFNPALPSLGCHCQKECSAGDLNCSCIRQNGGGFPYTSNQVLVSRMPLVYECGSSCSCLPNCKNRVSQSGLKARFEVFKTKDRGWGLRSWDPIRAGTFICEYAGEVIDKAKVERDDYEKNDYIFDTTRTFDQSFKWNYDPVLIEEEAHEEPIEDYEIPFPLVISAKDAGNIARFMNHSCSPNVFWHPIVYEQNSESFIHIAFFATRHIPPMTELTYDYGVSRSERGRKQCFCGSPKCKRYFG